MSRTSIYVALVFSAAFMLADCVPGTSRYFAPEAQSGTLTTTHGECNDVKDALVFHDPDLDWVMIRVHADAGDKDRAWVRLSIYKEVPDVFGAFDSDKTYQEHLKQYVEMDKRPIRIAFDDDHISVSTAAGERLQLPLALPGGEGRSFTLADRYFEQTFGIAAPGDGFDIDIPVVAFDGARLEIPHIRFTRASSVVMQGINC